MGEKQNNNNNNCEDKHQKLETIPWYLCRKLDMLGCCHGHLIIIVHQNDSLIIVVVVGGGGGGRTSSCMPIPKLVERAKYCDKIGMTTKVCSLWLLFFKP